MANKGGQLTPQWLGSITAKVLGVTALGGCWPSQWGDRFVQGDLEGSHKHSQN
jgi:hypothetical protein